MNLSYLFGGKAETYMTMTKTGVRPDPWLSTGKNLPCAGLNVYHFG